MEKSDAPSVYFIYHGGCPDGFFAAMIFDLWRQAAGKGNLKELLKKAFYREQKLTMDPPTVICGKDGIKDFEGKVTKAEDWAAEGGSYDDTVYLKIMYTSVESNLKDIVKCAKKKDIAIIADIGNIEVLESLYQNFDTVYFLDHHQSALDGGLSKPEFVDRHKNTTFFYDTKVSACRLIYTVLLKDGSDILQNYYSKDFGDNLTRMVDTISRGDTNSTLNLTEVERQFKAGVCNLSDIQSFSKNGNPTHLRKIANFDYEVLQKLGKSHVEEIEKAIAPELIKAELGQYTYESISQRKELTLNFLMLYSNSKYRSDLGNYLSQISHEEGFDPVSLVYTEHTGKKGFFKASWRALDLPTHEHVNLTEVCAFFNGGGHKHAAGSELSPQDLLKLKSKHKRKGGPSSLTKEEKVKEEEVQPKTEKTDSNLQPDPADPKD